ncbi:Hemolysin, contains CBS domains [Halobiforma haloterrestris]|uniref:Hemolysin, contains CBS domains n=1 Tax=Natronobacterium haloterrestre TaxID=148448 RepID=A0A1I1HLA5_NATHA|nr:hemolysin family protein [Halobiforma haloterrestris]SFC24909.1 Hemolysin, contains CBS domains [Halobiforma haloterrestris]
MVDLALSGARVGAALVLVALNGFFVAAEFAFVRVRSTAVESLVADGRTGATLLAEVMDNLDDYLAVTQLGITIASLGLGWIGEPAVAALIEPAVGPFLPEGTVHLVAFAVGFGVITFLHVVFGELAPKTIAIARAERIALLVAAPMKAFYYLFVPGIVVFNGTANAFTRLIGIPPASETDETFTEEELRMALARSGEEGNVAADEVEMIDRVFELDDVTAREVMVPRPDVRSVPADLPLADLRDRIVETGHTRYPVVDAGDPDRVVGLVDAKDVIRAGTLEAEGEVGDGDGDGDGDDRTTTAGDLAHDIPVVPETVAVSDLLSDLQRERAQMAAVIDEWGVLEGIVTVEDVVEVVVGDLHDEFDVPSREPSIDRDASEEGVAVDGGVALSTVNEELGTTFDHDAVETIGGLVLARLGRPPESGDRVSIAGHELTVTAVDGMRASTVVVRPESGTFEGTAESATDGAAGDDTALESERAERSEGS